MERNRVEGYWWSAVCATLVWWIVVLYLENAFPFERSWWHFAIGGLLVALSIALLIWWQSFPSSEGRQIWSMLFGAAGAKSPSADPADHGSAEPSPATEADQPTAEDAPPDALTTEADPAPASPPTDPPPQPTSSPALSGQMSGGRPPVLTDLVASVRPAVVCIQTASGSGSGFIINEHGTIVTNRHVVGRHPRVTVRLDDGRRIGGRVSRLHPAADLAIVRITAPHLQSVPLTDAHRVAVGASVAAFGFPLDSSIGPEITVTEGIVSAKRTRHGFQELQTSAAVNPGNSGGPLVDVATGGVVGVIFAGIDEGPDGAAIEGINFAISINVVKDWLTPI